MALPLSLRLARLRSTSELVFVRFFASELTCEKSPSDREESARPFDEIPGPKGLPVLGSLLEFIKDGGIPNLHNSSMARFERYGPIYKETIWGKTRVFLSDSIEAEKLIRADGRYPFRPPMEPVVHARQQQNFPVGFSQMQGEEWYKHRQALSPKMLQPKSVQKNMDNFNDVTSDLVKRFVTLTAATGHESEISDLQTHLFDWSTESIGSFLFDTRIGLFEPSPREEARSFIYSVNQFLNTLVPQLLHSLPFYKLFKTPAYKKLMEHQSVFVNFVKYAIAKKLEELNMDMETEYKAENVPGAVALSFILTKKEFTADEIVMNVIELFAAGIDTTAYTAQWLLYNLAKNPDVQERVYQEVDPLLTGKDGVLSAANLSKIPYLKACLKESQRLYPIAFTFNRNVQEDLVLCGFKVPAGVEIYIHNYTAGRSEKNFKDSKEFRPQRWLREVKDEIHPFSVLPFGFGPRMCIGRRVAEVEIFSLVSKLIKTFKLSYNHEDVKSTIKLLMVPDRPVKLTFTARQ